MPTRAITVLMALFAGQASAAADATAADFNAAWQAYVAARDAGDTEARVAAAGRALEIAEVLLPAGDERLPLLTTNYGVSLVAAKREDEAWKILAKALERAEAVHGEGALELIPYLEILADASGERGSSRAQRKEFDRALDIAERHHGNDSVTYAELLTRAGVSILSRSQSRDARRYLEDAAEIYAGMPDVDPTKPAMTAFWLGKLSLRRPRAASADFEQALTGFAAAAEPPTEFELVTHAHLVNAYESLGESELATKHCLAIGARRPDRSEADLMPVFRKAPSYPGELLRAGRQGSVDFSFTVDEQGFVRDAVVVDEEGGYGFERAAREAVEAFRYAPMFKDGEAVAVDGVKTRITFRIEN